MVSPFTSNRRWLKAGVNWAGTDESDVWKDFGNIIEYDATGIDKVTNRSDVKEISRYSLNGQRVTSPTKGVNIVVYSDGSIKKVAVQ